MSVADSLVDASGWADQRDYTHNRIDPFAAMKQRLPLWVAATCLVGALCQPDVQATIRHLQQAADDGDTVGASFDLADEADGAGAAAPGRPRIDAASAALVEHVVATMAAGKTGPGVPAPDDAASSGLARAAASSAVSPTSSPTMAAPGASNATAGKPGAPVTMPLVAVGTGAGSLDPAAAARTGSRSKTLVAPPVAAGPVLVPPNGRLADAYVAPAQVALVRHISANWRVADDQIQRYVSKVWRVAGELELDPFLVLAVMATESSFNPRAQSPRGAQGLMQVHTRVHREKFRPHGGPSRAFDPEASIRVGSVILKQYLGRHGGNARGALKSYVGAANLKSDGGYANKVLKRHAEFKQVVRSELTRLSAAGKLKANAGPRVMASAVNSGSMPH